MAQAESRGSERPTFTERARRAQLIEVTQQLIGELGSARTSLARIADAAGVTKAAVLYYFPSKSAVVKAAFADVLQALVARVGAAVESADIGDRPGVYVRSMVGHLRENPMHARVMISALIEGEVDDDGSQRWLVLAQMIDAAVASRGGGGIDSRTLAVITGGGIDGIIAEQLRDPAYDGQGAAEQLVGMLDGAVGRQGV